MLNVSKVKRFLIFAALLLALVATTPAALAEDFSGTTPGTHVVNITAGSTVYASASGEPTCTADTVLTVYQPGGAVVAFNDDSGPGCGGYDSDVAFTAPATGDYTFSVEDYWGGNEPYTLTVTVSETEPPSVHFFGGTTPGTHVVTVPAGSVVGATASGAPTCVADTMLTVSDPGGTVVALNDDNYGPVCWGLDSFLAFTASVGGDYTFLVEDYPGGGCGGNYPYTLTVTVYPPLAAPVRCTTTFEFGSVDPAPISGELRFFTHFGYETFAPEGWTQGKIAVEGGQYTSGMVGVDCGTHVRAWLFDANGDVVGLVPSQYENGDGVFELGVEEFGVGTGGNAMYVGTYANLIPSE